MKKAIFMFLFFGAYAANALAAPQIKIGYVDLQKALNECDEGKEAKTTFNRRVEELQKILDDKQIELKSLQEELEKQKGLLTPEAKTEKEKAYQQKLKDVQRFAKDSQEELQQKDMEMTKRIIRELRDIIKKMGDDDKYTMIMERGESFVLYAAEGIDLTDRLIKEYNKMMKK